MVGVGVLVSMVHGAFGGFRLLGVTSCDQKVTSYVTRFLGYHIDVGIQLFMSRPEPAPNAPKPDPPLAPMPDPEPKVLLTCTKSCELFNHALKIIRRI